MTWAPAKNDTLEAISTEILHNYRRGRFMIAVDGIEGSGTETFADELADTLRSVATTTDGRPVAVVRASVSDLPGEIGATPTAASVYRGAVDFPAVRTEVIEPFRSGSASLPAGASADGEISPDAVLVIDGVFLLRPELRGAWNYSLWLNVPRHLADERLVGSDQLEHGSDQTIDARRGARDLYWSEAEPRTTATAIVDNTDPEHPRRVFADSC